MNLSQPLIIIADSQDTNIAYYSELVQAAGARALATEQSGNVVNLVASHQPALLILDSSFRDPDSYNVLNLLKANEQTLHIPILFVTANLSERPMSLHEDLFARVDVVAKPINERILQEKVKRYLTLNRLRHQIATLNTDKDKNLLEAREEGILALDQHGQILFANAAAERMLKTTALKLTGNYLETILEEACGNVRSKWKDHPIAKVTRSDQILQVDKAMLCRADGERIQAKFAAIPVNSLPDVAMLFAFRQLKDTREAKDKLAKLSHVDHLTNLPLRAPLEEQIDRCILKAGISGFYFALLYVDLDHFRYINESMGHDRGDQLIREVAKRIQSLIRRDDMVGRMEGDEFVVVLSHIDLPDNAGAVAQKVIDQVREAFLIDGHQVFTGCSIGVSVYPTCGDDARTLLKNAEVALSRAKAVGRNNYQYFTAEMNKQRVEQMQLEYELHQAVDQRQWRVQFQPVAALESRQLVACEIKLSWMNPLRGELLLDEFLPVAEESGLAPVIFRWFWQQALERVANMNVNQREAVKLLLPVSPSLLMQEGGVEWITGIVQANGIAPEQIFVELPESSFAVRHTQLSAVLNQLRKQGFHLILDNFGTGFAPLKLLRDIPYSLIRLGDLFVSAIKDSRDDQAIIKGVLNLAHEMGLMVMASEVNSAEQYQFLQQSGCDWLAGDAVLEQIDSLPKQMEALGMFVFPG
jgi:diguanylate cyclase (GGDEF)-like protein